MLQIRTGPTDLLIKVIAVMCKCDIIVKLDKGIVVQNSNIRIITFREENDGEGLAKINRLKIKFRV